MTGTTSGDEYRVTDWTADELLITDAEMLADVRENVSACDMQDELAVGQIVSHAKLMYEPGSQRGDLLIIHGDNRAAIMLGADSDWGDWNPAEATIALDAGPVLHVAGTLVYTDEPERVTPEHIRRLLDYSPRADATLIRWSDTGEVDVVPAVLFTDISYSERDRDYELIASASDLRSQGDWDADNPTAEDYEAFAEQLNEA